VPSATAPGWAASTKAAGEPDSDEYTVIMAPARRKDPEVKFVSTLPSTADQQLSRQQPGDDTLACAVHTTEDQTVAAGHSVEVDPARWQELLEELLGRVAGRFARVDLRRRARALVCGLLAELPRKNCWTIAEHAGDPNPDGMQHLLTRAVWEEDKVRDDVCDDVVDRLGDPQATLVIRRDGRSEEGHPHGRRAAPVHRHRRSGGNAQVAVYLVYATDAGHAVVDRELYLPRSWTDDPDRMRAAGVPEQVGFATKPELATTMICLTLDAGVPAAWVTGDEVYGNSPGLRAKLEARGAGYVLPGACDHWLMVRRNRTTGELAFYRCYTPPHPAARPAQSRRPAGESRRPSRQAKALLVWTSTKSAAGAPDTAGPPWRCSPRLPGRRSAAERTRHPAPPELIPVTCNEIQRLFATLLARPAGDRDHRLHWSVWRRRHQARARTCHYRRQAAWDHEDHDLRLEYQAGAGHHRLQHRRRADRGHLCERCWPSQRPFANASPAVSTTSASAIPSARSIDRFFMVAASFHLTL